MSKFASRRDERELAMKFVDGLSSRIRMLVAGHCYDTVDKAIAGATSIEAERGLFLAEQQQSGGKGKSPMLVRSQSASAGGPSSSGSGPFRRVKNWVGTALVVVVGSSSTSHSSGGSSRTNSHSSSDSSL